jgi:hypothetical protein
MDEIAEVTARKSKLKSDYTSSRIRKKTSSKTANSLVDQIWHLLRIIGNQEFQRLFNSGTPQAKVKSGKPSSRYEGDKRSIRR